MGEAGMDWLTAASRARKAHELLGSHQADLDALPLRSVVRESWRRSLSSPVQIGHPPMLSDDSLRLARERSELQRIWPVFEKLLVPAASDANLLVALADAQGTLLWVAGSRGAMDGAEDVGFSEGANWRESSVGTSAPGVALATGRGAQVSGAEHLSERVHHLNCSAVPIRNPQTGRIIGVVDLTGGADAAAVHSLPLLQAAVSAAEGQLLLPALAMERPDEDFLDLCASDGPRLSGKPISLRHAEILTVLAAHPRGLNSAQLVEELFEQPDGASEGTLRSELVRLRKFLADSPFRRIAARPYRLQWQLQTTLTRLWSAMEDGDLERALQLYPAEILVRSQAPGIAALRCRAQIALREIVLDRGSAQQLLRLGRQSADSQLLLASLRELPLDSPVRPLLVAEIEALEA